eukprot:scaffold14195_cov65-Cyclotella_meneghiniana.AAC.10
MTKLATCSTIAVATIVCILVLPRATAFLSNIAKKRHAKSRGMTRLPDGMPIMPEDVLKYSQLPGIDKVFTVSSSFNIL